MDTALEASAFEDNVDRAACKFSNNSRLLLGALVSVNEDGPDAWHQTLREVQPALHKIGDNDGFCTPSPCSEE